MFKHLLVPLDGSHLAESVLPLAGFLAVKLGASITLIHVIEHNAPQEVHGERHLTDPEEAYAYLEQLSEQSLPAGVAVERHVHTAEVNNVARSIVEHADELEPDLILLCTHGSSGVKGMLIGSIAQQVIGMGSTPVLLIHPPEKPQDSFTCRQILVPMDGNAEHEQSLPVALMLAQACHTRLHLLVVVPTLSTLKPDRAATGKLLPATMMALLNITEESAQDYLRDKLDQLHSSNVPITAEVQRGDVPSEIVAVANRINADMIVLGTHGRAGAGAFWEGSVGPKLPGMTGIPLLFIPIQTGDNPGTSG
ncbi:MAG: universal stress protein [Chloroflexi bacterium]|nr:universal stress protein [Chloroflexota bacterium]